MHDRYQILGLLGKGGVSTIHRAVDLETGRQVAVKRLLPLDETLLNEPQLNGLHREALALAQLKHPNIVQLYEFGEDDEGPFAILELLEGESLLDVIREGALPYPDFLEVATQLLSALRAAGELRLLHRDLKPGNIILTVNDDGYLVTKLLDFGMAKFSSQPSLQTVDHKGAILGTVDYVAPEQLDQQPIDHRADLYSLGCILYFCLTQVPPFQGLSAAETIRNHLDHEVTELHRLRRDIPLIVSDWVMKLIARDPDERPLGAAHALTILEKIEAFEQVPGARLEDIEDFTAPLPASSLLHQRFTKIDPVENHHQPPEEKAIPARQPMRHPEKSAKPAKPANLVKSVTPAKPAKQAKSAKPAKSAKSAKSAKPSAGKKA